MDVLERSLENPWGGTGSLKGLVSLSLFLVIVSLVTLMMMAEVSSTPDDTPAYVYLTWATPDTAHTINVSWRTDGNYVGEVRYDNEPHGGDPGAYSHSTEGTGGVTTAKFDGYIHHVELMGLEPETMYYFICGNSGYGWSEELSFKTAPVEEKDIKFVVGGDSRSGFGISPHPDWQEARDKITQLAASCNPDFVNFNGDFLSNGEEQYTPDTWDNWLGAWYKYMRTEDGRLIPMIPVIGNHELVYPQPSDYNPGEDASNYYMLFNLPGNERWYSLDWGPDLHLIILDSEIMSTTSESWAEQLEWLEQDLEEHRDCLWKIVSFHRPVYSGGKHGGELRRLENWVYRFDMYRVDTVFASHDHGYERTGPINHLLHPEELMDSQVNGRIYVVTAGWGAPLYPGENSWFTAPDSPGRLGKAENAYHCCVVNIFETGTLHMQAMDANGEAFDELFLYGGVEVSISPSENRGLSGGGVTFTVTVKNETGGEDGFDLTVDSEWAAGLSSDTVGPLPHGSSENVILTVSIPEDACYGDEDTVTVTAISQTDPEIKGNASCIARATLARYVEVSISPADNAGMLGENVIFTVTIKNTGVETDNYNLMVEDTEGWSLSLPSWVGPLASAEQIDVTLEVSIPTDSAPGDDDNITITATSQTDSAVSDSDNCFAHAVTENWGVSVKILPRENTGAPGETVTFIVIIKNMGVNADTYSLLTGDNAYWSLSLSPTGVSLHGGVEATAILTVEISPTAEPCTRDNIRVRAISTHMHADNSCVAHAAAPGPGVSVSILPRENTGAPGESVTFTVVITNTGDITDAYDLAVGDNAGWNPTLDEDLFGGVAPGDNRTTTLRVLIPEDAENFTRDSITVTATSQADSSVSDSATCTAIAGEEAAPTEELPIVPIIVGGAAMGAGIVIALLLWKGVISLPALHSGLTHSLYSRPPLSIVCLCSTVNCLSSTLPIIFLTLNYKTKQN